MLLKLNGLPFQMSVKSQTVLLRTEARQGKKSGDFLLGRTLIKLIYLCYTLFILWYKFLGLCGRGEGIWIRFFIDSCHCCTLLVALWPVWCKCICRYCTYNIMLLTAAILRGKSTLQTALKVIGTKNILKQTEVKVAFLKKKIAVRCDWTRRNSWFWSAFN